MVTKTSHLPIRYLLALLWAHPILHISAIRVKDRRGYCQLKEEVLDRTMWRNRFGRFFGHVVWKITDGNDGRYVRATCFDLVGHPQALQEIIPKSYLVFLHCGIPNVYKFLSQEHEIAATQVQFLQAYILYAPATKTCKHLGSHNAKKKLNNSWICFLGGPEDDLLGRNMWPWHIYHCI